MTCAGCPDCCGPVLAREEEWAAVRAWASENGISSVRPIIEDGDPQCGFLGDDGRCRIYPVRPLICRMYGAGPREIGGLRCPRAAGAPAMDVRAHDAMLKEYAALGPLVAYDEGERAAWDRWNAAPTPPAAFQV